MLKQFSRIESIAQQINNYVPEDKRGTDEFRADLAGFLVVTIASSYENCIKSTMVDFAATKHKSFEYFTERKFDKLNSKISYSDLYRYSKLFGTQIEENFKTTIKARQERIEKYTGFNIKAGYEQQLRWRHAYAHAGKRETTIKEALKFHRYARWTVITFAESFLKIQSDQLILHNVDQQHSDANLIS